MGSADRVATTDAIRLRHNGVRRMVRPLSRKYLGVRRSQLFIFSLSVMFGCGLDHTAMQHGWLPPPVLDFGPSEGTFESGVAENLHDGPGVVEVELEARVAEIEFIPGIRTSMWSYNGMVPGPRIEARVGDTVRVKLKNSLPEPTTIHWHGLRVPAAMDGVLAMQNPVLPGQEFTYEFIVADAGTFWYHPHVRSDEQVERGLYGAFVVRDESEPVTTSDRTVVLDDVLLNDDGTLADFDEKPAMFGRQGNLILVNGRHHPVAEVAPGGLHRFRFVNAANARYFRLNLPGHRMIQVGTDGGLLDEPHVVEELLLVPGERADVLIVADDIPLASSSMMTLRYDRGHGSGEIPDAVVFQLRTRDMAAIVTPPIPKRLGAIEGLPEPGLRREITLEESMQGGGGPHAGHGGGTGGPVFSFNREVYPDATPLEAQLDAVEEWAVVNTTAMDHPFHLHGFRFQIVSEDGRAPRVGGWRDTINIPAQKTVVIRMRLEDHPGTWMFHCHILEHAERGMTGELHVAAP